MSPVPLPPGVDELRKMQRQVDDALREQASRAHVERTAHAIILAVVLVLTCAACPLAAVLAWRLAWWL